MSYVRDRVIILRTTPFREHDRKVVMFGAQHGLLEAVARGANAKQAKQGGHIIPLTKAEVLIAKGASFDKLAVVRTVSAHAGLRRRLGALAFAGGFADLFERLQRPGIVDIDLYELMSQVLSVAESLPEEPSTERARLLYSAAALKLLDRIGFAPPLSACASCREPFQAAIGEHWLLPADGAFLCHDCYRTVRRANQDAQAVPARTLTLLRFLRREPLGRVLLLTGTPADFQGATYAVSLLLRQAPLKKEPHGAETIAAILG